MGTSQGINVPVRWVLGRVAEVRVMHIQLLSSDQTEYEEHISGKGDNLYQNIVRIRIRIRMIK